MYIELKVEREFDSQKKGREREIVLANCEWLKQYSRKKFIKL